MKFVDVAALADASLSTTGNQSFGNLELFETEQGQEPYGTLELNQFLLDGSKAILPETPDDIAFWSNVKSGNDCAFAENPQVAIQFSTTHSSAGLTLYFADEYPVEIKVTWYTLAGTKIDSATFYPDALVYVCEKQVSDYGKVTIEFIKTALPGRYIKMQYILYGVYLSWQDDLIQAASINEEIDVTSATISINTADISIVDVNNDFDIGNESGAWKCIQKNQEVTLSEYLDGEMIPCGTFFVDTWDFRDNVANFSLIDSVGRMDYYQFEKGQVYSGVKAGLILEAIFAASGITKYTITEEVYNTLLNGYLAAQSCRAALQMVCFAVGAVADDSRSDTINVYMPDRYVKSTVGPDRKFNGNTVISLDEYVSGVSITCNRYNLEAEESEIYDDVLPAGKNKITFSAPYLPASITAQGGTILESNYNYVIISMASSGNCTITGRKYESTEFSYRKDVEMMEPGERENVKEFGSCTLYNADGLADLAESLLKYYILRKLVNMKYILENEQVGQWCNIKDVRGNVATTMLESQSLDLAGGFLADASCRGYSTVVTDYYFTGTELYAEGNGII